MKQKITIEKMRELELKKSMLNVKIFSLMKKQLFSLVMVLALIVFAGTSAWAQDGLTVATAYWHSPGSSHNVTVDSHVNSNYVWAITLSNCDGTAGGAVEPGTGIVGTANTAVITYGANAAGVYRTTVTESGTDGGCSTIRQFYTAIMNVNVVVVSTLDDGVTAAAASSCNDYNITGPTLSYLVPNLTVEDGGGTSAQLNTYTNNARYNERYATVTLSVAASDGGCGVGGAPTATSLAWRFNYVVAGLNYSAPDNFITLAPAENILPVGGGAVIYQTPTSDGTDNAFITVDRGVTSFKIPLQSNIRWGLNDTDQDQSFTLTVSNVAVDDDATLNYTDGGESAANAADRNVSVAQKIDASPATPRITIND